MVALLHRLPSPTLSKTSPYDLAIPHARYHSHDQAFRSSLLDILDVAENVDAIGCAHGGVMRGDEVVLDWCAEWETKMATM